MSAMEAHDPSYLTPPRSTTNSIHDSQNPNHAWSKLVSSQPFESFLTKKSTERPYDPTTSTRIVCISDTHGKHREIELPCGDVLIHGGDFTSTGEPNTVADLSQFFGEQLRLGKFKEILCIAGNHELTFHEEHYQEIHPYFHRKPFDCSAARAALTNCTYLEDATCTVNGLQCYGSPWQPLFHHWAFNLPRGFPCREKWEKIPSSTDILITHGPPLGRGDEVQTDGHVGCVDLLHQIQKRVYPRIHIFGHIHEGYGISSDGTTLFVNASSVTKFYQPVNPCIVIDIPHDKSKPVVVVEPMSDLSSTEVIAWLGKNEFTQPLVSSFQSSNISLQGKDLLTKSLDDLCFHLNIKDRGTKHKIIRTLQMFRADCFK